MKQVGENSHCMDRDLKYNTLVKKYKYSEGGKVCCKRKEINPLINHIS
jgi:hypothetical protein